MLNAIISTTHWRIWSVVMGKVMVQLDDVTSEKIIILTLLSSMMMTMKTGTRSRGLRRFIPD